MEKCKQLIIDKLGSALPTVDPKQIRLREKISEKLTQVYDDSFPLEKYQMHDDKEVALQIVPDNEQVF